MLINHANYEQMPLAKGAETDVPLCPNVSVPTGSQDCKHLSSLPVISRPFKRNFNNKQFSPTSEANLQVCCNFTKWEHSGSTENQDQQAVAWEAKSESVGRRVYSRRRGRKRDKKRQDTECLVLLPPETRRQPAYPGMFLITAHLTTSSHWLVC